MPKPPRRDKPTPPPGPRLRRLAAELYAGLSDSPSREEVQGAAMELLNRDGREANDAGGPTPAKQLCEELRGLLQQVEVRLTAAVPGYAEDDMVSRFGAAKTMLAAALDRAETLAADDLSSY